MKRVLKNNAKTAAYLNSLPTMYLVGCWAMYGVQDLPWSGKYVKNKRTGMMEPLVWIFTDFNGLYEKWRLVPIWYVTTGEIICWTENEKMAVRIASALNIREEIGGNEDLVGRY